MKYGYWYALLEEGICELCRKETKILTDAIDCVYEGSECLNFEGFIEICEKCLESKAEAHLKEFHSSVDLV